MSLVDQFGRVHQSLRLSVTDRCNIRCFYCMPSEHVEFLPRPEILTFEELTRVARVFAGLGITRIRLTGGEPLVRKDLAELVRQIRAIDSIEEIAMTTNAILLARHARSLRDAGLDRINVSLDTLDSAQFESITRRDSLDEAVRGIAAARDAGFRNLRLNAVAVKGLIEDQIVPLMRFSIEHDLALRFIEFMPLNSTGKWESQDVLTGVEIRRILEREFGPLSAIERADPAQPASDYRFENARGMVGFICPISQPFCEDCNRVRLTAEGKIRNCLFSTREWDIRELLRSEADDDLIRARIIDCVANKKASHGIGASDFEKPKRAMYQIGG